METTHGVVWLPSSAAGCGCGGNPMFTMSWARRPAGSSGDGGGPPVAVIAAAAAAATAVAAPVVVSSCGSTVGGCRGRLVGGGWFSASGPALVAVVEAVGKM